MKLIRTTIIAILGSLVLLSGCGDQLPTDIPDPYGVDGFLTLGWNAYADADYEQALEYFKEAIDLDVAGVEGYVGAGWSALFVTDYWRVADEYFYMAIQHDAGTFPMIEMMESQTQDTMWTVFECLHPDLPPAVLDPILAMTADSGAQWVGDEIYAIVGTDPIPYRFMQNDAISMFDVTNGFSQDVIDVDSLSGGYIYVTVPRTNVEISGNYYDTWINADNVMSYDYRSFAATGSETQFTYDALVGIVMLQDIRAENGDKLLGCGAAQGLESLVTDYSFGLGKRYAGYETIDNVEIMGTAAAIAFADQAFRYSWYLCLSMGYGGSLDPEDATFVTDLMVVIENMLNS